MSGVTLADRLNRPTSAAARAPHDRGRSKPSPGHVPPSAALLLALQRSAGNAAVARLAAQRSVGVGRKHSVVAVQRCGPTPCDCSDEERADYAATHPEEAYHPKTTAAEQAVQRCVGVDPQPGSMPPSHQPVDNEEAGTEVVARSPILTVPLADHRDEAFMTGRRTTGPLAPVPLQRSEVVVQREGFESTVDICHRVLESRHFKISKGGLRVVVVPNNVDMSVPNCRDFTFRVTLTRSHEWWSDDEIGTCEAKTGGIRSFSFANLTSGTYYLTISRIFDHPRCCLTGDLMVFDEPVAGDSETCRRNKDPSAMDIVHGALDIAGFIPVLGAVPDGINAGIYALEGTGPMPGCRRWPWCPAGVTVFTWG
jgi:hypothetical protein